MRVRLRTAFKASIGYKYGDNTPGRRYLEIADPNQYPEADWRDEMTALPAHELGHVIGLHHEHQRAEAAQHVRIQCSAVVGYAQAWARLNQYPNNPRFRADESMVDRMRRVCTVLDLAAVYFHKMLDLVPGGEAYGNDPNLYTHKSYDDAFDCKSIMLYGLDGAAARSDFNDKSTWTLTNTEDKWPNRREGFRDIVFWGGSDRYVNKAISAWYRYRVAQLYPRVAHSWVSTTRPQAQ